jgi:iron complex outermembrane receptor protein
MGIGARHFALVCLLVPAAAQAADRHAFAIPAGALGPALLAVGAQGHVDIALADPGIAMRPSVGLSGRMTAAAALARLLRGTGYAAREVRPGSFLVARLPSPPPPRQAPRQAPHPTIAPPEQDIGGGIVVLASKRGVSLSDYSGSAVVVPLGASGRGVVDDVTSLVARLPQVQSTAFGADRDKLFVRGIADSSFAGPTQSTVGAYFGDTRMLYSGSDPNLRLVDMNRVEILEGPQGTLYGAGAIGGIIRLMPNAPNALALSGSVEAAGAATQDGRPGYDVSGVLNVPVVSDLLGVRLVGYRAMDGGYIDAPLRDRDAINRTGTTGGRVAARITPGARWTIDLSGLAQKIHAADPQYAVRGFGPLAQGAPIAQPYHDDFVLGSATVQHQTDAGLDLLATAGVVDRHSQLRYDATRADQPPSAYDEHTDANMVSGELRLSRTAASGLNWLVGASAVQDHSATRRQLGPPDAQRDISGVDNRTLDLALFGEATVTPLPGLSLTGGARLTHARMDGQPLAARPQSAFVNGESRTRADPTFGFTLRLTPQLSWFGRYGRGFRTGGLAVAAGVGRTAVYQPDSITVGETGLRFDRLLGGTLSGSIAVARAIWNQVQADLIGANGFPYTANVGDGRITTGEATLAWTPVSRLRVDASGLLAHSSLTHPAPTFGLQGGDPLPDTPGASGSITVSWAPPVDATDRLRINLSGRHQGPSRLGAGPLLNVDQRGYTVADLELRLLRGRRTLALQLDNLANARGDRFAIGDPFQFRREDQYTPLRPRTLRVVLSTSFGPPG